MKIVFSTKNVNRPSFLDTCRFAYDYGFSGFEIYDAIKERTTHNDSILRRDHTADSKRKLINRNLSVSALTYPVPLNSAEADSDILVKYVDMASNSGVENLIVRIEEETSFDDLKEKLSRILNNIKCYTDGCYAAQFETPQSYYEKLMGAYGR